MFDNLVPRASFPLTSGRKTRALGATISGMRHRCRCAVSRITRIRLFPLFFHNGCSQSSRFPTAGQGERSSGNEIACSTQSTTVNNVIKWLQPSQWNDIVFLCCYFLKIYHVRILANLLIVLLFRVNLIATKFMWMLSGNDPCSERFLGARLGYLHRNLVAKASNLGVPGYRAPVRQQPCVV